MVLSTRRTYADAVSWINSARPAAFRRVRLAGKIFGGFFLAGVVGFGLASLVSPEGFGQEGARVLNLGWRTVALVGMIVGGTIILVLNSRRIAALASRNLTRPYALGPGEGRAYEAAVNALAACARPLQLRFALARSLGPALFACAGAVLAVSAAYFAIYSVLGGFDVGVETAASAVGSVVLSFGLLLVAAPRLATWRLATSVYRVVTPRYLA
jgi:hypothetical protein